MPKLAMGMSEGTITTWRYEAGAFVEKGAILLDLETEKVSYELEAQASGYLNIMVPAGQTVKVDHVIAFLADSPGETPAAAPAVTAAGETAAAEPATSAAPVEPAGKRAPASPLARKLAEQNGIDLAGIAGNGPNGRIEKGDVEAVIAARQAAPAPAQAAAGPSAAPSADPAAGVSRARAVLPLKGVRRVIANNMMKSLAEAAQMSATFEADASEIVRLRERLAARADAAGGRVSYLDILVKIVACAANRVPIVNSAIVEDEIRVWDEVNIGIAIATEISEYESGLFVPVVKNADAKPLLAISREIRELSDRARSGRLTPEQMSGGTITLSSAAFVGGLVCTTPILTPGQAVLVQPGPIIEKPVVRDGKVAACPVITFSVTWDHRIVDGVPIGKLAGKITELMECPELLM